MEISIDNRAFEASQGETVLQVALRNGLEIPHFCYHPCLSIAGNCRMCLVKLEGVSKLMPSCNLGVAANMKVETGAPEVVKARQSVMQFLMLNHPVDCGICDKAGECRLQDYQFAHGVPRSRSLEPKHHKRKLHDLTPRIQLDNERCILCSRCVRFTSEISKSNLLGIVERGGHSFVDGNPDATVSDVYSDNVIGLCPTGALLSRDFLYRSRVWFLEPVRSVCTGCARGCSVDLWRRRKEWTLRAPGEDRSRTIYRVTAGENPEINGPWICNKGFDLHRSMERERVVTPSVDGAPATLQQALDAARERLARAQRPAALVSAHASNEELDAFKAALGARMAVYAREDHAPAAGEVIEDDLLIRADKNPNSFGVQQRFGAGRWSADRANAHDFFLVWGEWPDYAALGDVPIVHLTPFAGPAPRPPVVVIPISTTFERAGTFSNFEGKTNRFQPVFDKPDRVEHASDVFAGLAR